MLLSKYPLVVALAALLFVILSNPCSGQSVNSDSWAATDALGRKVRSYDEAPSKRDGKFVGIFYWTWHNNRHNPADTVRNISEIVREYPEAMADYNHPAWGSKKPYYFYWEQPLFGYYQTTDKWVLRKHAELLADAGVDAVFFDCTNGSLTFKESYEALMETWEQALKDGVNVPKVSFILNLWPQPTTPVSLRQLYNDVYKPGRYRDLWFVWKGKPCLMAYPDDLTDSQEDREIAEFFTFRPGQPDYVNGPDPKRNDQWGWLEDYPQHGYVSSKDESGNTVYEQVTVGVAQNTSPDRNGHCGAFNVKDAYGRNFSIRNGFDPRPDGYLYGWNISEQWERAYELDPELVFVTGWNEYIAGMWLPKDKWNGDPFSFVDQYNWVCSRDIEPNKGWGDKGDVYYLQLVDRIRKFKGMKPADPVSGPKTIRLGRLSDWDDVGPYFASYKGNTLPRDYDGAANMHYEDYSGRNDIVGAKVARDSKYIYFYVETADKLTSPSDPRWMRLFIDIDRDKATGWNGYDFVVNRVSPRHSKAVLEINIQGIWMWKACRRVKFKVKDNVLVIRIPRAAVGAEEGPLDFEFKWNDNMQSEGDIMDFYVSGDTAPGGRFNYVYTAKETSGSGTPRGVIFDTDWWTDVDDVCALRTLLHAEREGGIRLLGVCLSAVDSSSVSSLSSYLGYEGRKGLLLGADKLAVDYPGSPSWRDVILEAVPQREASSLDDVDDAVPFYRKLLSKEKEPVDIVAVGFPNALSRLLESGPDEWSPLSGRELVSRKVRHLWMMAGQYPEGREHNFALSQRSRDAGAAICEGWPTGITFLGYEVGIKLRLGGNLPEEDLLHKVLAVHGSASGRYAWDPLMAWMACLGEPETAGFETVSGKVTLDPETGENHFSYASDGPHRYVRMVRDSSWYADQFIPVLGEKETVVYTVEDAPGYNCWPMIQSVGDRLVCVYTVGKNHDTSEKGRGAYARYSDDGARSWSGRILIDENPDYGTSSIGKGVDSEGNALFWIRRMNADPRMALYRTCDGKTFELISTPSLDPNPMQITDIFHTPEGLECLWFSDDYSDDHDNKSWGVLVSRDDGLTWEQRIIEKDLPKKDWPTEPSAIVIGDGCLLAIARSEMAGGHQFQLTSYDWGRTWKKTTTNIDDVLQSTPTLILDKDEGLVYNYYYQRGDGLLKVRTAQVNDILKDGNAWPEPQILAEGGRERPYDSGNANAVALKSRHFITYYSGDSVNCRVVVAARR